MERRADCWPPARSDTWMSPPRPKPPCAPPARVVRAFYPAIARSGGSGASCGGAPPLSKNPTSATPGPPHAERRAGAEWVFFFVLPVQTASRSGARPCAPPRRPRGGIAILVRISTWHHGQRQRRNIFCSDARVPCRPPSHPFAAVSRPAAARERTAARAQLVTRRWPAAAVSAPRSATPRAHRTARAGGIPRPAAG